MSIDAERKIMTEIMDSIKDNFEGDYEEFNLPLEECII